MRTLEEYAERYANARVVRDAAGVLEVTLHSDGGSLVWTEAAHRELPLLFADIAADPENRVVILTGAGDVFCEERSFEVWRAMEASARWAKLHLEGKRLLENLLAIDVPVIGAVNGPARVHAELIALSDIVLASQTAVFQDAPHFAEGFVPGDGTHIFWPLVLGPNRGRYFLLTAQEIDADEALRLGFVHEVLAPDALLDRTRALAATLARASTLALRGTKAATTQRIKRHLLDDLGFGLALESRAAVADAYPEARDWTGREHL